MARRTDFRRLAFHREDDVRLPGHASRQSLPRCNPAIPRSVEKPRLGGKSPGKSGAIANVLHGCRAASAFCAGRAIVSRNRRCCGRRLRLWKPASRPARNRGGDNDQGRDLPFTPPVAAGRRRHHGGGPRGRTRFRQGADARHAGALLLPLQARQRRSDHRVGRPAAARRSAQEFPRSDRRPRWTSSSPTISCRSTTRVLEQNTWSQHRRPAGAVRYRHGQPEAVRPDHRQADGDA